MDTNRFALTSTLLLWHMLSSLFLHGQQYNQITYESKSDFSAIIVRSIAIDNEGYVWAGSDKGLIRTNGYNTRTFVDSLPSRYIKDVERLNDGSIAIAHDKGIHRVISKNGKPAFNCMINGSDTCTHTTSYFAKNIFQTTDSTVWISDNCGILRYKNRQLQKRYVFSPDNLQSSYHNSLFFTEDTRQRLWTMSLNGNLFRYNAAADSFRKVNFCGKVEWVTDMQFIKPGIIWIGANTGLYELDLANSKDDKHNCRPLDMQEAVTDIERMGGKILVSTGNKKLYQCNISDKIPDFRRIKLKNPAGINQMYATDNQLWLATNNGIFLLQKQFFNFLDIEKPGIYFGDVVYQGAALSSDGTPYIASGNSIFRVKSGQNPLSYQKVHTCSTGAVGALRVGAKGIWFEVEHQQFRFYSFSTGRTRLVYTYKGPEASRNALHIDAKGNFWILMNNSEIVRISPDFQVHRYSQKYLHSEPLQMIELRNEKLFISGKGRKSYMMRYCYDTDTFINVSPALSGKTGDEFEVSDMVAGEQGQLWLATPNGLYRYHYTSDEEQTCKKTYFEQPYASKGIVSINRTTDNSLWMATMYGVLRYKADKLAIYKHSSGVSVQNILYRQMLVDKNQRLWIGTTNGVVYSQPVGTMAPQTTKPVFTRLALDNLEIQTEKLHGYPNKANFNARFFAADYPTRNLTYEIKWIQNKEDTLSKQQAEPVFTRQNLAHGSYVLRVRARQEAMGKIWSEYATVKFNIRRAWYTRWWAWSIYATLLVLFTGAVIRMNTLRLRREKSRLENIVNQRTKEVETQKEELKAQAEKLKQSNEELLALHRFKKNMTNMIVHDLKNPLNSLLNLNYSSNRNEERKRIHHSARQMLNMVMNILDVSRYEETRMKLNIQKSEASEILAEAISQVHLLSKDKNIEIENDVPTGLSIRVDREITRRIWVNLLSNAIKYAPMSSTVKVSYQVSGRWIYFTVTDRGEGIPYEHQDEIFDTFTQVSAQKAGQVSSSGIGLSFCKMAVEAHKGSIGVNSMPGKGSTFWFTMPLDEQKHVVTRNENTGTFRENLATLEVQDKDYLQQFVKKLRTTEFYKITAFNSIMREIEAKSESLQQWKHQIRRAFKYWDFISYAALLNLATPTQILKAEKPGFEETEYRVLKTHINQLATINLQNKQTVNQLLNELKQSIQSQDFRSWLAKLEQAAKKQDEARYRQLLTFIADDLPHD